MGFLLDTNVVSDSRRLEHTSAPFRAAMRAIAEQESFLSVVTLTEIRLGIQRQRKRDTVFAVILETWLRVALLERFGERILDLTPTIALIAGGLPCTTRQPTFDALIAATALHHGHTVVTRNVKDFVPLGVDVLDPWTG